MIDSELQLRNEQSEKLLEEARNLYQSIELDASERCALAVIDNLEEYAKNFVNDSVQDKNSQLYKMIDLMAHAYNRLNVIAISRSEYAQSLKYAQQSIEYCTCINDKHRKANVLGNIASVYYKQGDYVRALEYYRMSLSIHEAHEDQSEIAKIMGNIGSVYTNLGAYQLSMEYYRRSLVINQELGNETLIARDTNNIGLAYASLGMYNESMEYMNTALEIYERLGDKLLTAKIIGSIGSIYSDMGFNNEALTNISRALSIYEEFGDLSELASTSMNLGTVFMELGYYAQAHQYIEKALALHTEIGNAFSIANTLENYGILWYCEENYDKAIEYYNQALALFTEIGAKSGIAHVTGSIGAAYMQQGQYMRAIEYFENAYHLHEELGEKAHAARVMGNIGTLYADAHFDGGDLEKAEEFLQKSIEVHEKIGAKRNLQEHYRSLSDMYRRAERWKEADISFRKFYEVEKEIQNEEARKNAEQIDYIRKSAEREKEIAIANAKHQATEQLLHNVLPPTIAARMLDGTQLIAEKIPSVSVLFADIVNFTKLSQSITPEELVEGLDRIFSEFDALVEKHGLEKIKTIGDAYMVVAGAPEVRADHAETMANFALEMIEKMKEFRSISTGEEVQIRIGIHSGEVVAGVIGKKKFAYDLWGDAVNTASRMESHGEAGKIHVSEDFVRELGMRNEKLGMKDKELTGDNSQFIFVPRGEMEIKGKGKMRTYFLEKL